MAGDDEQAEPWVQATQRAFDGMFQKPKLTAKLLRRVLACSRAHGRTCRRRVG
jgi:hypothetical protein